MVKNLPANAGDIRDAGSITGLGRSPGGEGMATHSSILAWRIPWTEEPGRLQSMESQGQTRLKQLSTHVSIFLCSEKTLLLGLLPSWGLSKN